MQRYGFFLRGARVVTDGGEGCHGLRVFLGGVAMCGRLFGRCHPSMADELGLWRSAVVVNGGRFCVGRYLLPVACRKRICAFLFSFFVIYILRVIYIDENSSFSFRGRCVCVLLFFCGNG